MTTVPSVSVPDLPADAVLLDVREQDEWDAGHAPSAVHVPMSELAGRLGDLPDQDSPVFVICRSGGRSARVAQYLNANGWDATNVDGGMQSWAQQSKDMVATLNDAEPQVL